MSLRQKMTLANVLGIAGLLLAVAGVYTDGGVPAALAGLALLCGGVCLMFRWKRCPYCGAFLGRSSLPKFCPGCGKRIDADAKEEARKEVDTKEDGHEKKRREKKIDAKNLNSGGRYGLF